MELFATSTSRGGQSEEHALLFRRRPCVSTQKSSA
jgi:hypothetical protein